jgi:phosphoserine phosphatase
MRGNGAYAALVSGGFTAFTGAIAGVLGFDENRANTLLVEAGKLTGQVADPILGKAAKVQALEEISARLGITPARRSRWATGRMIWACWASPAWAWRCMPSPAVQAEARVRVNHGDLTALLYLQGYARDAFLG